MKRLLSSVLYICIALWGHAQLPSGTDSTMAAYKLPDNQDRPTVFEASPSIIQANPTDFFPESGKPLSDIRFDNIALSRTADIRQSSPTYRDYPHIGFYAYSKENAYLNLLDSRSATAAFYLQYYNLRFDALLTAGKYLGAAKSGPMVPTNQFGISGALQYDFSPNWSIAAWGSYYNVNPYYSMAALPFIQTSSYGGFLQYKGNKAGIKLGARSYYDAFRRQWRTEPIVTPSINISKKVKFEFPIGPLIQQSLERAILQSRGNGPIIPPQRP